MINAQVWDISPRNNRVYIQTNPRSGLYQRYTLDFPEGEYHVRELTSKFQNLLNQQIGFGWVVYTSDCGNRIIVKVRHIKKD